MLQSDAARRWHGAGVAIAEPGAERGRNAAGAVAHRVLCTGADDPIADSKAVVTLGHARFTVLTPQLIRMEWSADGKFEDHASFVFINRRLSVPKFVTASQPEQGAQVRSIKTDALTLTYDPSR